RAVGSNPIKTLRVRGLASTRRTPDRARTRFSTCRAPCPSHPGRWTRSRPGSAWRTRGWAVTSVLIVLNAFGRHFLGRPWPARLSPHGGSAVLRPRCPRPPRGYGLLPEGPSYPDTGCSTRAAPPGGPRSPRRGPCRKAVGPSHWSPAAHHLACHPEV